MDREVVVLRDALQMIIDIGFDYDGYENSLEGCKSLIDELVKIADDALNRKQSPTYIMEDTIVNVFDEVVGTCDDKFNLEYFDKNRKDY